MSSEPIRFRAPWIEPELAKFLARVPPERLSSNALDFADLPAHRERAALLPVPETIPGVTFEDRTLPRSSLRVRIFAPDNRTRMLPAMLWIHGGGMVSGRVEGDNRRLSEYAAAAGLVCVSVDYRLAPEHPYPAPLDDCYAALVWLAENAAELGVDASRLAIGGASAGGGLTAATTLLARDREGPALQFQLLASPMLDHRNATRSIQEAENLPTWNRRCNRGGWEAYLGPLADSDAVPGYASPARAQDLAGLPPAFIDVGSADGFRDEVFDYAQRLMHAGVPVELHLYAGAFHGFEAFAPDSRIALEAARLRAEALRRAMYPDA